MPISLQIVIILLKYIELKGVTNPLEKGTWVKL